MACRASGRGAGRAALRPPAGGGEDGAELGIRRITLSWCAWWMGMRSGRSCRWHRLEVFLVAWPEVAGTQFGGVSRTAATPLADPDDPELAQVPILLKQLAADIFNELFCRRAVAGHYRGEPAAGRTGRPSERRLQALPRSGRKPRLRRWRQRCSDARALRWARSYAAAWRGPGPPAGTLFATASDGEGGDRNGGARICRRAAGRAASRAAGSRSRRLRRGWRL
jgi:hypothetical protein